MISPTNAILTGLAVSDMAVMISYFPYAIHNFFRKNLTQEEQFSTGWAYFTLFHAHFTVVCHTISIWLTVILAIWRYLAVRYMLLDCSGSYVKNRSPQQSTNTQAMSTASTMSYQDE